ncbi:MAG: hypothetical protein JWR28_3434 [Modestobacter sp.]|nr:hypothetical protein [Modestobacter sp.]
MAGRRNRRRTERYPAAVKCTAQRRDGQPCGRLATRGAHVCATHGAQLPVVREAAARAVQEARLRLKLLHDPAVDTLTELLGDRDPRVRLGAVALLHKVSPLEAPAGGGGGLEDQPQQLRSRYEMGCPGRTPFELGRQPSRDTGPTICPTVPRSGHPAAPTASRGEQLVRHLLDVVDPSRTRPSLSPASATQRVGRL